MSDPDVFSYGVVSASTLYTVNAAFPAAEDYAEIEREDFMTGGEATNSSIVLARLGARVMLDGNWLGDDDAGRRVRALLDRYRIDTSRLTFRKDYGSVREVVFAANGTRTIFGTYGKMLDGADWNRPKERDIVRAKVVCLDPFFGEASLRVASIGFEAGIPVVTVDCPCDAALLACTSAVVIAESYLRENYAGEQVDDVFRRYLDATPGLVIFTFGDSRIWYAKPGGQIAAFEPYPVEVLDTSGAGDAFRAGVVYGFLKGWEVDEIIRFSSAVAAIVCTRSPGVLDAPGYDEVVNFIGRVQS